MIGDEAEIAIRCEHSEIVTNAELSEHGVYRGDLHAGTATHVSQVRSLDVVITVRHEKWERPEALQYLPSRLWPGKTLEQLLKDQACSQHGLSVS